MGLINNPEILVLSSKTYPHPMSTIYTQSLINQLCNMPDTRYLEVGILRGASYFAAAYNNNGTYYGVDNWSKYGRIVELIHDDIPEDDPDHVTYESNLGIVLGYIERYKSENREFIYFNEDAWELDLSQFEHKINVFFYDGDHSFESQEKILRHFDSILDDEIILIVDDYYSPEIGEIVREATAKAIENSKFSLVYDCELLNEDEKNKNINKWHNGLYIAHLKR